MISRKLTRKEFAEKCFAEILSDGDKHTYAEICEYTIQQAQGTKFQNIIDKQGLSGTLRNFIAKDSHYQKVRYGVYQWNDILPLPTNTLEESMNPSKFLPLYGKPRWNG